MQAVMARIAEAREGAAGYLRPRTLGEALHELASGSWTVLAGGTDVLPMHGEGPLRVPVLDITAIESLRGIVSGADGWRIGGLTSWTQILDSELPPAFDGLKLAAREIGSVQIQNRATLAGNLCNASPAADGIPPLLCLDAEVELCSAHARRQIPLADFLQGYRRTARRPDELLTSIFVPRSAGEGRSDFLKLGARRFLVISIAMAAVRLVLDRDGRIRTARIAVGACSAMAQRLAGLGDRLAGHDPRQGFSAILNEADLSVLSPIDDVRAPASYRLAAARELVGRLLERASA